MSDFGVVVEGGRKMVLKCEYNSTVHYIVHSTLNITNCSFICAASAGVATFEKITDEEFIALENDFDDIEAPPGPFKLQPETQGRLTSAPCTKSRGGDINS